MTASKNAATRGQRRGFLWQDWYAAREMLRCSGALELGIEAVEVEADGADHIDDVISYFKDRVVFRQLKHTVNDDGTFTGADLFSASSGKPLIAKLYNGWSKVKHDNPLLVEVHLTTNRKGSDQSRKFISPDGFRRGILIPARSPSWSPSADIEEEYEQIRTICGAPNANEFRDFLAALYLDFEQPNIDRLRTDVIDLLSARLRPSAILEVEADAWMARVYDISTRHGGRAKFERADIQRELLDFFGASEQVEHRLLLPENHLPREQVAKSVMEAARKLDEGYLVVTGQPGCGKTTLATWIANKHKDEILMRYHVFDPNKTSRVELKQRASALEFVTNMFGVLSNRFPDDARASFPSSERLGEAVTGLRSQLESIANERLRFVIVDGIDHVIRAGRDRDPLFDALPQHAPEGVVFILFGQPDWDYPPWLKRAQRVEVPDFEAAETQTLVLRRFGWSDSDHAARAVASVLHDKSKGNPLSLFYNLNLLRQFGPTPEEVFEHIRSISLFGGTPHDEYRRLLDDIEPNLPIPGNSKSLGREMLACIAVATTAITEERLCRAFSDVGLSTHQARDYIDGLGPVVVELGAGQYWIFHDDFRRYAEEMTSIEDRTNAHRRLANALDEDWQGNELASMAEHLWLGGADDRLAALPQDLSLDGWFDRATPPVVVKMHKLALAAAFRLADDVSIMRNAFAAARASEAAELLWHDEALADENRLKYWSFVPPPKGVGYIALQRRTSALLAATDAYRDSPAFASEIAGRFLMPLESLDDVDEIGMHDARDYIHAHARWHWISGALADVSALLENEDCKNSASNAIGEVFDSEQDPTILGDWTKQIGGRDEGLDWKIIRAAAKHLANGRHAATTNIARSFIECQTVSAEIHRDAVVLLSLVDGRILNGSSESLCAAGVRWESGRDSSSLKWQDFFFHGFVDAALGGVKGLGRHEFPSSFKEAFEGHSGQEADGLVARHIWRSGCAAGLSLRGESLLMQQDLESVVLPYCGVRLPGLERRWQYMLRDAAHAFLPMLALAFRNAQPLAQRMAELVREFATENLTSPNGFLFGSLEALWVLDQAAWRSLAERAFSITYLPDTEASERVEWFKYWRRAAEDRSVMLPPEFVRRASLAGLGVPRKSDPAWLAVDLVCKDPEHKDVVNRVRRMTNLLIRLNAEPEGGRAANRNLPRVLALALKADASKFEAEFMRCAVENDLAEPFGSLPEEVTARCIATNPRLSTSELYALWHWMAASPGSLGRDSSGGATATKIAERLIEVGARAEADEIREWLACIALPRETGNDRDESLDTIKASSSRPTPDIKDVETTWFSPSWGGDKHEVLRKHLGAGGENAWRSVCGQLSDQVAAADDMHAYAFQIVAEGICDLRPELPRPEAIDIAIEHFAEKVCFQAEPPAAKQGSSQDRSAVEAIVGLIARGIDVSDTETVRRTLRSLAALATNAGTRETVFKELSQRLYSEDVRTVQMALCVLRHATDLPEEVTEAIGVLEQHPDAWCRYLACNILHSEPEWLAPRTIVFGSGLVIPDYGPTKSDVGATYYSGATAVREVYLRKLGALVDQGHDALRSWLDSELSSLSDLEERSLGWQYHRGPTLNEDRVSEAAGRLACRLASEEEDLPALLSVVSPFDPWMALAPPQVSPPPSWIEICRSEMGYVERRETYLIRSLGLVRREALEGTNALAREELAEVACHFLHPDPPRTYAWVSERWRGVAPPTLQRGPVVLLSFLNSMFTPLHLAGFDLVPCFGFAPFRELTYELGDVPCWVHPRFGTVIQAAKYERASEPSGAEHAKIDSWNGWYASPEWLASLVANTDEIELVRIWRKEMSAEGLFRRDGRPETTVEYGLERVKLDEV